MIEKMRAEVRSIHVDDKIFNYIGEVIFATRTPGDYGLSRLESLIEFGASPRATLNFVKAARAKAFLSGRSFVTPEDVKYLSYDILRHRLLLSYEADAQEVGVEEVISEIISKVRVP